MKRRDFIFSVAAMAWAHSAIGRTVSSLVSAQRKPAHGRWFRRLLKAIGLYKFQNASGSLKFQVERYYSTSTDAPSLIVTDRPESPRTLGLAALNEFLAEAAEMNDRPVRAHGGKWSFSPILTVGELGKHGYHKGFMLDPRSFAHTEMGFAAELFDDRFIQRQPEEAQRICFAQTGCSVRDLNQFLESRGCALPTSGGGDGQTFVGAMSTGTHGAAITRGAIQDYVRALHIAVAPGSSFIIQRASAPIFSRAIADAFGANELISDDELFLSAVVSFGSFGLIHGAFIQADPLYKVHAQLRQVDFDQKVHDAISKLDVTQLGFAADPYHFELVLNPYQTGASKRGIFAQIMYRVSASTPSSPSLKNGDKTPSRFESDLAAAATDLLPFIIPGETTHFLIKSMRESRGNEVVWTPGEAFHSRGVPSRAISSEIGVPVRFAVQALEIGARLAQHHPYPGVLATRFVKSSEAYLAFTMHDDVTCTIEMASLDSARTEKFLHRYWAELTRAGIPFTWHWGQMNDYNADNIRAKLGTERVNHWLNARRNFLPPAARARFSNELLKRCGLHA